jgi:hypothetical protein
MTLSTRGDLQFDLSIRVRTSYLTALRFIRTLEIVLRWWDTPTLPTVAEHFWRAN